MSEFKVGMYVRCPIEEDYRNSRVFFLGQISNVSEDTHLVSVVFHDTDGIRRLFSELPPTLEIDSRYISRCKALTETEVRLKNKSKVKIVSYAGKNPEDGFSYYYVENKTKESCEYWKVSEKDMLISFARANCNPMEQLLKYELQNPKWYLQRRVVSDSLNTIRNAPYGFETLLGARAYLLSHQVDTIVRALTEKPCRLMLADEVGLGKTIEACTIMKGLMEQMVGLRTLFIIPETLIYQWQTELSYKFWLEVPIWGDDKIKADENTLLISTENICSPEALEVLNQKWDLLIIDETHRLLNNSAQYETVFHLSCQIENILLLSATPILQRGQEYFKLLTILNPSRFEKMASEQFEALLAKQKFIRDSVFEMMRDLQDYVPYDLSADYVSKLTDLSESVGDEKLKGLIREINTDMPDKGLNQVKLVLAYIAEFYQLERNIIRHRRLELAERLGPRAKEEITYTMAGADQGFYEENCYEQLLNYLEVLAEVNEHSSQAFEFSKFFLSAMFSSPWALKGLIEKRLNILQSQQNTYNGPVTNSKERENERIYNALAALATYPDELEILERIEALCRQWRQSTEGEIQRIHEVCNDVDLFNSRIAKVIDYVDQDDVKGTKKYIIFTGWTETTEQLEVSFSRFFGEKSTTSFHRGMQKEEMQEAASFFQNEEDCRFMICDESGGEGRNFQMADTIIHFDLPWSLVQLEQRIGRLDRIGRPKNKEVVSFVCYSEGTIENDLFRIWNEGLNIFHESLCGMEIAFEQIYGLVATALQKDIRFGMSKVMDEIKSFSEVMKREIEKERYFDLARQLDIDLQEKFQKLIQKYTENDGQKLMDTMLSWPKIAGFYGISVINPFKDGKNIVSIDTTKISLRSLQNALFLVPPIEEIVKRSKYRNDIRGTFSRTAAIKHENIAFFAPGDAFFNGIVRNAEESYRGRACAFSFESKVCSWTGLVMRWNICFNLNLLLDKGYRLDCLALVRQYLAAEQITYLYPLEESSVEVPQGTILHEIETLSMNSKIKHLGKREPYVDPITQKQTSASREFKVEYQRDLWKPTLEKVYAEAKEWVTEKAKELIRVAEARNHLEMVFHAHKARQVFYEEMAQTGLLTDEKLIEVLLKGLKNPKIELDSVAYVKIEKWESLNGAGDP